MLANCCFCSGACILSSYHVTFKFSCEFSFLELLPDQIRTIESLLGPGLTKIENKFYWTSFEENSTMRKCDVNVVVNLGQKNEEYSLYSSLFTWFHFGPKSVWGCVELVLFVVRHWRHTQPEPGWCEPGPQGNPRMAPVLCNL